MFRSGERLTGRIADLRTRFGNLRNRFADGGVTAQTLRDYLTLLSGQVGRLVFSLVYFLVLANALSLAEFGLFATASAVGVTLSRIAAFGFVSPLYRISCRNRLLTGSYWLGYLVAFAASLPFVAALGWIVHEAFFSSDMALLAFAVVLVSEIALWRTAEVLVIVNNGLNRFARASAMVIANTALRALAALGFSFGAHGGLATWVWYYAAANLTVLLASLVILRPGARLIWAPRSWLARWRDALGVAGAELMFYAQSELDKVLVLAIGGPRIAGLYAIVMRLADLTAIPLRSMMTLLIQRIMARRSLGGTWKLWAGLEGGVFVASAFAMGALAFVLSVAPTALGANVETAAPFVAIVLLVPGFRNLVEFHTEILYAFERTTERLWQLAFVGLGKAILLGAMLQATTTFAELAPWLTPAFATLYVLSAAYTYRSLSRNGFAVAPHGAQSG